MSPTHPDVSNTADLDGALASESLPPLPRKRGEPVFGNSWEAEAYAIGNLLVKEGLVRRDRWMELMAEAIRRAQQAGDPDGGDTYYQHWCSALECVCFQQEWISPQAYEELLTLWAQAIANTPHGVPLALENADAMPLGDSHHHHHHDHDHDHAIETGPPPDHYWTPIHSIRMTPSRPAA